MTGAFLIAAFATLVGALVAAFVLPLGEHEVGIASSLTASYVGGSVNFAALTDVTGLAETAPGIVSAMLAADNMASAAYLGLLAILPGFTFIARRFVKRDHTAGEVEESGEASEGRATPLSLGLTLAYALIVVAVGDFLTRLSGQPQLRYVIITVLALVLPTAIPNRMAKLHGGFELGVVFAFLFFAAIAAGANVVQLVTNAPMIIAYIAILLSIHAVIAFTLAKFCKLSLPEIIIASNAAILGATTAPALAAAKGWRDLVTPGVLVGVLGYALGTVLGTLVFSILG